MIIALGSDHGGLEYKNEIKNHLINLGHEVIDFGTDKKESCHYPIFAKAVANSVKDKKADLGVLVCTSGEGVCMVANKVSGCRAGIGYNDEVSHLMREHNNANIITFGQAFMKLEDVLRRVDIFLNATFEGGRHQTRVEMFEK